MKNSVLVFTVATNGYHWRYRRNIESHQQYARRYNYRYAVVDKPWFCTMGIESAWLKMSLLREALYAGYSWVFFIDADAKIQDSAPPVTSLELDRKYIYVTNGYSGKINSGVMLYKNSPFARRFVRDVLAMCDYDVPEEDSVGWGENGHVIYTAKRYRCVEIISKKWNNNQDINMDDYIRHYSAGPLQQYFRPLLIDKVIFTVCHYCLAILKRLDHINMYSASFKSCLSARLDALTKETIKKYPCFVNTSR